MKFFRTPASAATAAALLGAAACVYAQEAAAPQVPAPVVRVRPRTPAHAATESTGSTGAATGPGSGASRSASARPGYRDAFSVTYGPDGTHPAPAPALTHPAAAPAHQGTGQTGPPAARGTAGVTGFTAGAAGATSERRPAVAAGASGVTGRPAHPSTGVTGVHAAAGSTVTKAAEPTASATRAAAAGPTSAAGSSVVVPLETTGPLNRTTIVLDPAHGGGDDGSRLADALLEKDVTLALAFKLRSLLQARGFTVVMTREAEAPAGEAPPAPPSLDDRAGVANHARAAACLLLHATSSGTGVHLYRSELAAAPGEPAVDPWLTAQAVWVSQSTALADKFSQSLRRAGIPLVSSAASVRPLDSLTCPALVVELAPKSAGDTESLSSESYQADVSQALAATLVFWKSEVQPPKRVQTAPAEGAAQGATSARASGTRSAAGASGATGTPRPAGAAPRPSTATPSAAPSARREVQP